METVKCRVLVADDRTITLKLPETVRPGLYEVVVVVGESSGPEVASSEGFDFPVDHVGQWPARLSLRREDMYGDHGR
jgi:hypothetical protein